MIWLPVGYWLARDLFYFERAVISLFNRVSSCFFAAEIQQNKT